MIHFRKSFFLLLFLPITFALGAMGEGDSADEGISTALLNGPSGIGALHLMDTAHQLEELDPMDFQIFPGPSILVPSLIQGEFQAAVIPSNLAALLHSKGAPYKIAAVVGQGMLYVLGRGEPLPSFNPLQSQTLHLFGKGANPDYLTQYYLARYDMETPEDIILDFSFTHPDLTKALIADLVDYALLPEPFVTMALQQDPSLSILLDYQELWRKQNLSSYPISVLLISTDMIQNEPEKVKAYMEAYERSIHWVNDHPEEAADLMGQYDFTMDPQVVREAIPRCNLVFLEGQPAKEDLESFYQELYQMYPASIGGELPHEDAYLFFH